MPKLVAVEDSLSNVNQALRGQFSNRGEEKFVLICIVSEEGDK